MPDELKTLHVAEPIHRRLAVRAVNERKSLQEIANEAIAFYLANKRISRPAQKEAKP